MVDDAQRAELEKLVAEMLPKLVAEEVARQLAAQSARPVKQPAATPPQTDQVPHRIWEGKGDKDFVFDPPFPRRANLLIARGPDYTSFHIVQYVRSDVATRIVAEEEVRAYKGGVAVFPVPPNVTHLGIHSANGAWRVEIADLDELPALALPASGEKSAALGHRLGRMPVVIRSDDSVTVRFYELCDCAADCRRTTHQLSRQLAWTYQKGKTKFELPAEPGVVHIEADKPWSLEKRGR